MVELENAIGDMKHLRIDGSRWELFQKQKLERNRVYMRVWMKQKEFRSMQTAAAIVAVVGFALSGLAAQADTTFDLSNDFSIEANPNKVWEYGYSDTNSLAVDQFRLDKMADSNDTAAHASGCIKFWHPAANKGPGPGYYPYIAYNSSKQSEVGCKGWAVRPGEVAVEGSNIGQYSLIRFVAPVTGRYRVSAKFEGIHYGLSSTDVHVLHNGTSLFNADIDGYGGDPAFHKVQGASPTAEYSGEVAMKAEETLTFAVGYGKNKTHYGDTTGLFAKVVLLGDSRAIIK
jgi:hypothetical protein